MPPLASPVALTRLMDSSIVNFFSGTGGGRVLLLNSRGSSGSSLSRAQILATKFAEEERRAENTNRAGVRELAQVYVIMFEKVSQYCIV